VLPLLCALSYATSALLTRKIGAQESVWASMVYAALFGTIVAGAALPFVWQPVAAADLWRFVLIACLGTAAQLCIIRSFSITEASVVAPFSYLGIIFATGWGILLYDQWPDRWTVIGALVIVGAGLYVWHRETRASRPD
jgi:drug/metabolite transporter (DMT)-like permease